MDPGHSFLDAKDSHHPFSSVNLLSFPGVSVAVPYNLSSGLHELNGLTFKDCLSISSKFKAQTWAWLMST